ncbi:MAG TPA: hypothetical protein VHM90_18790 [Phycisphaerae bacterium]|nr:hypothetical protein [Phycisphaerae bacterium]
MDLREALEDFGDAAGARAGDDADEEPASVWGGEDFVDDELLEERVRTCLQRAAVL